MKGKLYYPNPNSEKLKLLSWVFSFLEFDTARFDPVTLDVAHPKFDRVASCLSTIITGDRFQSGKIEQIFVTYGLDQIDTYLNVLEKPPDQRSRRRGVRKHYRIKII